MKNLLLILALLPVLGHAAEFKTVQTDRSSITFGYKQMGVSMEGRFRKFSAQVNFDPANPTSAKTSLDVDIGSIDTGSDEANDEVKGKLWFNTKAFPTAHFSSASVKTLGGNRFDVTGQITIKGRSRSVTAPVTVTLQGNTAAFAGVFVLKRGDFAIGEGEWADFGSVANEVQIKFQIVATK